MIKINFFIKAYQKYNSIRCFIYKQISDYFYIKTYSNLYKDDDEGIKFFSKKDQKEIRKLIINHLKDDEFFIQEKLEKLIY